MSIHLKITQPCHEDWNTMTGDDKKRHCAVCNKHVHNFTQSTQEQVLSEYLLNIKEGTCGHMPKSGFQIKQNQVLQVVTRLVHQHSGKNLAFAILTVGTLLAANAEAQTNTQHADSAITTPYPIEELEGEVIMAGGIGPAPTVETAVYTIVEIMPEFPGGQEALFEYIKTHLDYPKGGAEGTAYVTFVVDENGKVTEVKLLKGIKDNLEANDAAIRLIENMPSWIPGKQRGKPVKVQYNLPIRFAPNR